MIETNGKPNTFSNESNPEQRVESLMVERDALLEAFTKLSEELEFVRSAQLEASAEREQEDQEIISTLRMMKGNIEELQAEKSSLVKEKESLEETIDKLCQEEAPPQQQRRIRFMVSALSARFKAHESLKNEILSLELENVRYKSRMEEFEEEQERLTIRCQSQEEALLLMDSDETRWKSRIEELESKCFLSPRDDMKIILETLKTQRNKLEVENKELELKCSKQQKQISSYEKEKEKHFDLITENTADQVMEQALIEEMELRLEELENKNQELEIRCAIQQQQFSNTRTYQKMQARNNETSLLDLEAPHPLSRTPSKRKTNPWKKGKPTRYDRESTGGLKPITENGESENDSSTEEKTDHCNDFVFSMDEMKKYIEELASQQRVAPNRLSVSNKELKEDETKMEETDTSRESGSKSKLQMEISDVRLEILKHVETSRKAAWNRLFGPMGKLTEERTKDVSISILTQDGVWSDSEHTESKSLAASGECKQKKDGVWC